MSRYERRPRIRKTKRLVLVVGEGRETEPNYFHGLKREQAVLDRFNVSIRRANGGSAFDVVYYAVKKMKETRQGRTPFDEVWCVLDVESQAGKATRRIPEARALAEEHGIKLIWSNPSFERWYLSHFEKTMRPFRDCDALIDVLNKHWLKHFSRDYEKNDTGVYSALKPRIETALENAEFALKEHHNRGSKILDANSATQVHELVRHLGL
jgi:hypothetical protein